MSNDLTNIRDQHINPYEEAVNKHQPQAGDIYAERNPSSNGFKIFKLIKKKENGWWTVACIKGNREYDSVSESSLKEYYRPILGNYEEILALAEKVAAGGAADVMALVTGEKKVQEATDSEALMATETPEHIAALLDTSEKMQAKLLEIKAIADIIIAEKKYELEEKLSQMNEYLSVMKDKVRNLVRVITILNLYTGQTVDINQITDGEPAPADEPLSIRQRILYMDEELCVHLDHEADYRDVPAFFEWLKDPVNRDIIVPEQRCVVSLKPKRFEMSYRSGDSYYDSMRNEWNKHTYIVIRNGERLYWFESDDLDVYDWVFPHLDFEEKFQETIKDGHFVDHNTRKHDNDRYRVTKFMMFLQGLIDQRQDIIGPLTVRPNLLKAKGVSLIRDDENLIGTGRMPWREFRDKKNELIRRGTRIVYIAAAYRYNDRDCLSGEFVRYYANQYNQPEFPGTGLYSVDETRYIDHYENHKPVYKTAPYLIFRYLPGDKVWDKTTWEERERKQRVSWRYVKSHVLNYDAVSLDELQEYLDDRTLREDFSSMIPVLIKMKLYKLEEKRNEDAFKALLSDAILRETGKAVDDGVMDEAIAWWKQKVIFTRPLRSDDRKAWSMIKSRITKKDK